MDSSRVFWASVEAASLKYDEVRFVLAEVARNPQKIFALPEVWRKWLFFSSGVIIGFYFGFRCGIVSQRAKKFVSEIPYMKAIGCQPFSNKIGVLQVEAPCHVKEHEILIEVKAASLDMIDLKVANGYGQGLRELVNRYNLNSMGQEESPVILGRDGAGVVVKTGENVYKVHPGDKVWFVIPYCLQGSLGNYVVLPEEYVRIMPHSLSYQTAATIPYTLITTWDLLVGQAGLKPHRINDLHVLVCGGLWPLEMLSVQLAKHWGCEVTVLSPSYTHDQWLSFGADHVIDTTNLRLDEGRDIKKRFRFDVVINAGGLLMQDVCHELAHKRVVTTLCVSPNLVEYGVYTNLLSSFFHCLWDGIRGCVVASGTRFSKIKIRPEALDYFRLLLDDKNQGFHFHDIGDRILSLDNIDVGARCLKAGGHHGKFVVKIEPFAKVCKVQGHIKCK